MSDPTQSPQPQPLSRPQRGSITVHPLANQADLIPGLPVDGATIRVLEESFALIALVLTPKAGPE